MPLISKKTNLNLYDPVWSKTEAGKDGVDFIYW